MSTNDVQKHYVLIKVNTNL